MKINFIIEANYLAAHTLKMVTEEKFSSTKYKADIVSFQNYAWNLSNTLYNYLIGRNRISPESTSEKFINSLSNRLESYLNKLKKSSEFKTIYEQTLCYLKECEKQWKNNYEISSKIIKDITNFDLNKSFNVYITHPGLRNGRYWKNNIISWGHNEDFPYYATIYLWHEILHSYFDNKSETSHSLIELIADNELRIRLNKGRYPPFEGHKQLFDLMNKILPLWRKYLKLDQKDFNTFRKEVEALLEKTNSAS